VLHPLNQSELAVKLVGIIMLAFALHPVATAVSVPHFAADRVIGWRGDGSGHWAGTTPPLKFSATENLCWKTDIGQGCGAAIVVGNRVFAQAAPNALVCLDKATGKEVWRRTRHAGQLATNLPAVMLDRTMDDVGAFRRLVQNSRSTTNAAVKQAQTWLPLRQLPGASINGYGNGDGSPSPVFAVGVFDWVSHAVRVTGGETPKGELLWDLGGATVANGTGFGVKEQKRTGPGDMTALAHGVTKNWAYGGLALAGDRLIVIHDNGIVKLIPLNDPAAPGAGNALPDDIYAQPTCDGRALYIRSLHALYFSKTAIAGCW
jgi:hypothetical protein